MMNRITRRRLFAAFPALLGLVLLPSPASAQSGLRPHHPPGIEPRHANPLHASASWPRQNDPAEANYTFQTIDPFGIAHWDEDPHGLNDARQVVVNWSDDANSGHALLWDDGKWTSLDYLDPKCPDAAIYLTSLSNRGIAFGEIWSESCNYSLAGGVDVRTGKWFTLPDIKDFPYNQGISLSDDGLAAGIAWNDANAVRHWIWNGRQYVFPTFPAGWDVSGWWTGPLFINDWGEIAGQYLDTSGRMRGYFQDGWKVTTFDAPGNPTSTAVNRITNNGDILVTANYAEGNAYYPSRSFIWNRGVFTPLPNVPFSNAQLTYVFGLNDRHDISGIWVDTVNPDLWRAWVAFRK